MAQTTQPQITIPSQTAPNTLTLADMRKIYQQRYTMAKRLQLGEWFVEAFGTEDQWTSQFTKQPYDKEGST